MYANLLLLLLCFEFLFSFCLRDREAETEERASEPERQRSSIHYISSYMSRAVGACQGKTGILELKSGLWHSSTWAITGCLPAHIHKKLDQKIGIWDWNKALQYGRWSPKQQLSCHNKHSILIYYFNISWTPKIKQLPLSIIFSCLCLTLSDKAVRSLCS